MDEQLTPGRVFGEWDAPLTDDHETGEAPVGQVCLYCSEPVQEGDNGRVSPVWLYQAENGATYPMGGQVEHRECGLRSVLGGIGHHVDHAHYCHGEAGPDAGLGFRRSALLVWEFFQETQLHPTDEQLEVWQDKVKQERRQQHGDL